MKYYRDNSTGEIITEDKLKEECVECISFAQDARASVECNGDRGGCSNFSRVYLEDLEEAELKRVRSFE